MRSLPRFTLILLIASISLGAALYFDWLPFLRGHEMFSWRWPHHIPPPARALTLIVSVALYLGIAGLLVRQQRDRLLLVWSVIASATIAAAIIYVRFDDVFYQLYLRTVSGITTGPHLAAALIDWGAERTWRDWPAVMLDFDTLSGHIALSPPGLPMFYGALNALLEPMTAFTQASQRLFLPLQCHNYTVITHTPAEWASAWFGLLMPLWAALTVVPLYGVARRLFPPSLARWSAVLWPLVPSIAMFAPSWNTLYPMVTILAFWAFLIGLEQRGWRAALWLGLAGLLVGVQTFANFAMLPLPFFFGVYTLAHSFMIERLPLQLREWRRPITIGLFFGLGLLLPWAIYYSVSGLTILDIMHIAMGRHLGQDKAYWPWVYFHAYEWAILSGMPLVLLYLIGTLQRLRDWRMPGGVVGIALLVTITTLTLSGSARGETGRVWTFFTPFVVLAALEWMNRHSLDEKRRHNMMTAVAMAQAAVLIGIAGTWGVIDVMDFRGVPPAPGPVAAERPAGVQFGELHLQAWDAELSDDAITLRLNWQVDTQPTTPYWFSALLVAPDGSAAGDSIIWQGLDTRYPTTCWQPGDIIGDTVTLPLPDDAPQTGDWWISLAVFADAADPEGSRLTVTQPDGSVDTQAGLGPVSGS